MVEVVRELQTRSLAEVARELQIAEAACEHVMPTRPAADGMKVCVYNLLPYFECSAGQCEVAVTSLIVACSRRRA